MPKNSRPGGIFGDMNYGWKGTTLNERIQAQNIWDLCEAQEIGNELAKQQIEQERENAQLKANAIKQAEKTRFNNQLQLEILKMSNENKQRQIRLCDDLGVDLNDLEIFYQKISHIDDTELLELTSQIKQVENKLKWCKENEPTIENLIYHEDKEINHLNDLINGYEKELARSSFFQKFTIRDRIRKLIEQVDSLEQRKSIKIKDFEQNKEERISKHNTRVQNLESEMKRLEKEADAKCKEIADTRNELIMNFNNFRSNHYNDEIEMLFRKLEMKFESVDIIKEGTVKDYNRYIRKIIESD